MYLQQNNLLHNQRDDQRDSLVTDHQQFLQMFQVDLLQIPQQRFLLQCLLCYLQQFHLHFLLSFPQAFLQMSQADLLHHFQQLFQLGFQQINPLKFHLVYLQPYRQSRHLIYLLQYHQVHQQMYLLGSQHLILRPSLQ